MRRIIHCADKAREILAENPVLRDKRTFDETVARHSTLCWSRRRSALAAVAALPRYSKPVAEIRRIASTSMRCGGDPAAARIDPCRSPSISMWMHGIERGLEWVKAGASAEVMDYFVQPAKMARDVEAERSPARRLRCGIGLVPVERLAESPIMSERIRQCLPAFPGTEYLELTPALLDCIAAHLDDAVDVVIALDPAGGRRFIDAIHTLHVGLRRDPLCSFSSANDMPGSSIVVLSLDRLADSDHSATAAQLLHETGHVLLGLYVAAARRPLPDDYVYVSPYKNDLQPIESIVHMCYTIPWECAVRIAALPETRDPSTLAHRLAFIIAYAARQGPIVEIARHGLARLGRATVSDLPALLSIPDWAGDVLSLVDQLVEAEPATRRKAHLQERRRVLARHAWDIGQIALRGAAVADPGVDAISVNAGRTQARVTYRGQVFRISASPFQATGKNYGAYVTAAENGATGEQSVERAS